MKICVIDILYPVNDYFCWQYFVHIVVCMMAVQCLNKDSHIARRNLVNFLYNMLKLHFKMRVAHENLSLSRLWPLFTYSYCEMLHFVSKMLLEYVCLSYAWDMAIICYIGVRFFRKAWDFIRLRVRVRNREKAWDSRSMREGWQPCICMKNVV